MEQEWVLEALGAEGARLAEVMLAVDEEAFERPTRCRPWSVRALLAHVLVASNRLPAMLDEPPPTEAKISASDYYRSDRRFSRQATDTRVATAMTDGAAFVSGHALAQAFDAAWREMVGRAGVEPPGRLVWTRWGDAMLLGDFLVTRVAELGLHGLDLADGLGREPWLTPHAASVVERLVIGDGGVESIPGLGWDRLTLIESATGRRPLADTERATLAQHGVRLLTFG